MRIYYNYYGIMIYKLRFEHKLIKSLLCCLRTNEKFLYDGIDIFVNRAFFSKNENSIIFELTYNMSNNER